jgi:hypothetical protein
MKPTGGSFRRDGSHNVEQLEDRADLRAWRRAREEAQGKGTIPWKRLKKQLHLE